MRWFGRDRPPDVWETGSQPDGDIEAAQRIREICAAASAIVERMATLRGVPASARGSLNRSLCSGSTCFEQVHPTSPHGKAGPFPHFYNTS